MKRQIILLLALILTGTAVWAQSDRTELLSSIAEAQRPQTGRTTVRQFVQTKHTPMLAQDAVSRGTLTISGTHKLRWQYTEPIDFTLVVDGDSIYTISQGKRTPMNGAAGRMTRGMAQMMSTLADGSGMLDEKLFDITLSEEGSSIATTLVPKRRDMRRMMQRVELRFKKKGYGIESVTIWEKDDSYTKIEFDKR